MGRMSQSIFAILICGISIFYALSSLTLAITLAHPLPTDDQWSAVASYFSFVDGQMSLSDLFAFHNEHKIPLTRVIVIADGYAFDMMGTFPILTTYIALAAVSILLAIIASDNLKQAIVLAGAGLGLLWSTSQYVNLSSPFQNCFAFVHLFSAATYAFLAMTMTHRRVAWFAAACVADFLAVFSLGSGVLTLFPAIAMTVWMRNASRYVLAFVLAHCIFTAAFFWGFQSPNYIALSSGLANYMTLFFQIVGSEFGGWMGWHIPAGQIGVTVFSAATAFVTWQSVLRRRSVDPWLCASLALATFCILESAMAAFTRLHVGGTPRYGTVSIVFFAAMLAFFWRAAAVGDIRFYARPIIAVVLAILCIGGNVQRNEDAWRERHALILKTTDELKRGDYSSPLLFLLRLTGGNISAKRMEETRLGPFK